MSRVWTCKTCQKKVPNLVNHIVAEHKDVVLKSGTETKDIARNFKVCHWTAYHVRKALEIPWRICPRCNEPLERLHAEKHIIDTHGLSLLIGHIAANMRYKDLSNMLLKGAFDPTTIGRVVRYHKSLEHENLPSLAVIICDDGNGGIRVMERGEIGLGIVYADKELSWL